jgi:hypothetical protein
MTLAMSSVLPAVTFDDGAAVMIMVTFTGTIGDVMSSVPQAVTFDDGAAVMIMLVTIMVAIAGTIGDVMFRIG